MGALDGMKVLDLAVPGWHDLDPVSRVLSGCSLQARKAATGRPGGRSNHQLPFPYGPSRLASPSLRPGPASPSPARHESGAGGQGVRADPCPRPLPAFTTTRPSSRGARLTSNSRPPTRMRFDRIHRLAGGRPVPSTQVPAARICEATAPPVFIFVLLGARDATRCRAWANRVRSDPARKHAALPPLA